jgi:VanZ family protein
MTRKISLYAPIVFWLCLIFFFSDQPVIKASNFDLVDFFIKKNAHFFEFFILFLLLHRALTKGRFQIAYLAAVSYAFSDEIHQMFIPGRTAALRDVFIDSLGVTTAFLLLKTGLLTCLYRSLGFKKPY